MPDALIRGDSQTYDWTLLTANGTSFDLSGCSVWFAVMPNTTGTTDADALFVQAIVIAGDGTTTRSVRYVNSTNTTVVATDELTVHPDGAASGKLVQLFPHTLTDGLDPATLVWEIQLEDATGGVHTIDTDTLTVMADRIRSMTVPA